MSGASGGRRREVLAVLQRAVAPLSIVEIAERLGVHANTVRFHLDSLEERGRVERVAPPRSRPGRPALLFRARRGMDPDGPRNYQALAGVLAAGLAAEPDAEARATESGRAWGRQLVAQSSEPAAGGAPVDRLVDVLDELGFAPERREGDEQIGLHHCPFLELVDERSDVVCPLHLGLMQGYLAGLTDEAAVTALEPFVEPDLCLTHLSL